MEKITIIKLGGSLITDKSRPMLAREKIMARLVKEIKKESLALVKKSNGKES